MKEYYIIGLFFIIIILFYLLYPIKNLNTRSSSLVAWKLNSNGVLELRTKSNAKLKAYFQKSGNIFGDRFWIDFPGELKTPRTIKGNGPIKEIRLGKPQKGKTRLVIEFEKNNFSEYPIPEICQKESDKNICIKNKIEIPVIPYKKKSSNALSWKLIGIDQNRWEIKLFSSLKKFSFEAIGEGVIFHKKKGEMLSPKIINYYLTLPNIKKGRYTVVIDPGHGGRDPGHIGIGGLREAEVTLDVSKRVKELLSEKGVSVKMTRDEDIYLDLPPRVSLANKTDADIFVSIHANASRGKRRDINGLETYYYSGYKGNLLAKRIQKQILKVSPGSPDRGVRRGRFYVIKNTRMPSVLVEIGFVTGRLDARRLEKSTHRKRLAYAISKGILEYLSKIE